MLRGRSAAAEQALAAGRASITVGGKRLWRHRHQLDTTDMTEQQWRQRWDAARMFLTADGESGKAGGNETIRGVDEHGQLRIKTPAALADELGTHLTIAAPVGFHHRGDEWAARVSARRAVRYDILYDPERDRWYLDASWKTSPEPARDIEELRAGPVLGVDLNDGHLACCVLDPGRVTRSVHRTASTWSPRACVRRGVMGGCARPSPPCLITPTSTTARR